MKKIKLPNWLYTIFGVRRSIIWKTEFAQTNNYFILKLTDNCDVDSDISFHKHIVKNGKNKIVKLNFKYEIINIGKNKFVKVYDESVC